MLNFNKSKCIILYQVERTKRKLFQVMEPQAENHDQERGPHVHKDKKIKYMVYILKDRCY